MGSIQTIITLILISSAVIVGMLMATNQIANAYNVTIVNEVNNSQYDYINETFTMIEDSSVKLQDQGTSESNAISNMLIGAYGSFRLFYQAPAIAMNMLYGIMADVEVPTFIITVIVGITLLIFSIAIIEAVFNRAV